MPLVLQLLLVMMSKYSKFRVDTFNTFWVMRYSKDFAPRLWWSSDHWASLFRRKNKQANNLHKCFTLHSRTQRKKNKRKHFYDSNLVEIISTIVSVRTFLWDYICQGVRAKKGLSASFLDLIRSHPSNYIYIMYV